MTVLGPETARGNPGLTWLSLRTECRCTIQEFPECPLLSVAYTPQAVSCQGQVLFCLMVVSLLSSSNVLHVFSLVVLHLPGCLEPFLYSSFLFYGVTEIKKIFPLAFVIAYIDYNLLTVLKLHFYA